MKVDVSKIGKMAYSKSSVMPKKTIASLRKIIVKLQTMEPTPIVAREIDMKNYIHIYTDGSDERKVRGIGGLWITDNQKFYWHGRLRNTVVDRWGKQKPIFLVELMAVYLQLVILKDGGFLKPGTRLMFWIDNMAAYASLCRGASREASGSADNIIQKCWVLIAENNCLIMK